MCCNTAAIQENKYRNFSASRETWQAVDLKFTLLSYGIIIVAIVVCDRGTVMSVHCSFMSMNIINSFALPIILNFAKSPIELLCP